MKKFVPLQIITLCAILLFYACGPDSPYTSLEVKQASGISDSSATLTGIYDTDGDTVNMQLFYSENTHNYDTLFNVEVCGKGMIAQEVLGLKASTNYSYYLQAIRKVDTKRTNQHGYFRQSKSGFFRTLDPPQIMTHEDSVAMHRIDSLLRSSGFDTISIPDMDIFRRYQESMPNANPTESENTEPVEI